jgi:3-hydroxyacyl-CoA dehydrogenase
MASSSDPVDTVPTPAENGAYAQQIIDLGGKEAGGLLVQIMDKNARDVECIQNSVQESLERKLAEETARADRAEAQLDRIRTRFLTMLELDW